MKKTFLLLAAGVIAATANGQEAHTSLMMQSVPVKANPKALSKPVKTVPVPLATKTDKTSTGTERTTLTGNCINCGRWYNYGGAYQFDLTTVEGNAQGDELPYLWFDTSSTDIYSASGGGDELDFNNLLSVGNVTDPTISGWNNSTISTVYPNYGGQGLIGITRLNPYVIDSIEILGVYGINPATRASYLYDTLRVVVTYGHPDVMSSTDNIIEGFFGPGLGGGYYADSLFFEILQHDSTDNIATGSAPTVGMTTKQDILLSAASVNDTDIATYTGGSGIYTGLFHTEVALTGATGPVSVPAGDIIGMSVTFISGDPNSPKMGVTHDYGDTVFTGDTGPNGPYRYSMFRPYVTNLQVLGATQWAPPPYLTGDMNEGNYEQQPSPSWAGLYLPMYAFYEPDGTTESPSGLQYSTMGYHIVCTTCDTLGTPALGVKNVASVNTVNAYPNPAADQLTISYTLVNSSSVAVTLTNMLGQVVATQKVANASAGKVVFNTNTLPEGMYIYTFDANGSLTTGHVAVAH